MGGTRTVAPYSVDSHESETGQGNENFNKCVIFTSEIMEATASMKQE